MSILRCFVAAVVACIVFSSAINAQDSYKLRTFKRQKLADRFFAEGATFGDLNKDGKADLIAGPYWFEGPTFAKQHEYYPVKPFDPNGYSDNFFAYVQDFNGDGWNDILIYGFPGKDASWFENPQGKDGDWKRNIVLPVVDNESPTWTDITGDGKAEVVCSVGGFFGFAEPNAEDPAKPWKFRRISDRSAGGNFTHGLGVGDVNGDGKMDLLEKSGWWEQPASLSGDPIWKKHAYAFSGPGGAQMYAYDVNGDGLNDVITGLAAHGFGLVWYEQLPGDKTAIKFKQNVITGTQPSDNPYGIKFAEIHAIDLVDMNGDGLKDIITGKRYWSHGLRGDPDPTTPGVIYWFELKRGADKAVEWIPHLIDDNSGVGVQVVAGDFTGDKQPDVIVANKQGIFAHVQEVKDVSKEDYDAAQPKKKVAAADGLSPEAAAKAMTVPPGFSVKLCAAEPDVLQPIAMAFDDRGRLWVAEAYSYPVRVADDKARDRILIFEDSDGDHKFDNRTVFIDTLNLVSGLQVGFGGVWVGAAPHLLFIPDKNGDDKPDGKPEIMLDGWAYQDTHETLNSFIWGPDGWLYGCHGVFTHSNVGKPGATNEQRTKINAGIWRYHPTRQEFEVFAEGTSNPWGIDFNDRGHAFATACVIPHLYHIIQGGRYQRQAGNHFNPNTYDDIKTIARHRHWVGNQWNDADRAMSDSIGGGHAHAGAMIYLGGAWPEKYRNQLFMNNIHGARLNQDQLTRAGSGYVGDAAPDFCFANDLWSQVVYLTYGPDGQVTMIDWYDRNQCHLREVPAHDRSNGRIFKIVYGDAKGVQVDLQKLSDAELVKLQLHDNEWYVRHARRILQERAAAGILAGDTHERLRKQFSDAPTTEKKLRTQWALHVTGGYTAAQYRELLKHNDSDIAAWAVQLFCERRDVPLDAIRDIYELGSRDDATVRLYVASALQRLPNLPFAIRRAAPDIFDVADRLTNREVFATDHNLPLMIWYGIEPHVLSEPEKAFLFARRSNIPLVARYIVRRMASDEVGYEELFAQLGGKVLGQEFDDASLIWMLEEIVAALKIRADLKMPKSWTPAFEKLMARRNPAIRQQAEFIAVKFGDARVMPELRKTLADKSLTFERRKLALDALIAGKDKELPPVLHGLLDDATVRTAGINALATFDHPKTPEVLVAAYAKLPATDQQAAIATLTARPAYVLALLDAIESKKISRNDLNAFTVRQLASLNDAQVTKRLNEVWGTIRATSADKTAEMTSFKQQLRPAALRQANLQHGREVYNKTCGTCHQLFGEGKKIGPDLTGSNRANLDYLLENLLDPSAVVGRDYQMTTVITNDGRVLNGLIKEETDSALALQTPTDIVNVAKSAIEERKLSALSLMPDGQLKQLKTDEARDLVAYLAAPAQVPLPGEGPYFDPATGRVAGAIEGETLKVLAKTGSAGPQDMGAFTQSKWSGKSQLWWTGGKPGDKLVLELPVEKAGRYEVFLTVAKAIDYGIVRLQLDDTQPTAPIDLVNNAVVNTPVSLGTHELSAGAHKLTVTIEGANARAVKAYMFGLDYVALVPRVKE